MLNCFGKFLTYFFNFKAEILIKYLVMDKLLLLDPKPGDLSKTRL